MSFSDPQSLTINAVATSLPRVSVEGSRSTYMDGTGNLQLTVSHINQGKRKRSMARVDQKKLGADPFVTTANIQSTVSAWVVVERPMNGTFTATEVKYLVDSLTKFLTDTSGANTAKLIAGES